MTLFRIPLRVTRAVVTVVVALDLLALAGLSLHRTTTTTTTTRPLSAVVPDQPPVSAPVTGSVPSGGIGNPGQVTVPVSSSTNSGNDQKPPAEHSHHTDHHPRTHHPAPPRSTVPPIKDVSIGKCPVKLAKPAQMGGVQSFVPFAPAFGPFSAEAFAAAAAYQPELELLGPILAQYPKLAPKISPLLDPVLKLFGTGSQQFYGLIKPLYSPSRTQVLQAETKLATTLAPYSKKLAGQPLAGCVVDLEAALVGDTA